MLDAYTVRKAVPRILLAVIGINLSIYFCVAALDITVIISRSIDQLLSAPFIGNDGIQIDGTTFNGNLVADGVLVAIVLLILKTVLLGPGVAALIGSLFPLIMIIVLIALAVLFTLVIRQALIIFLTVVSPVAIACFVLPGTEKYFKKWLDLFVKTLMVYPIIAVIFTMSNVMGAILLRDATGGGGVSLLSNTASFQTVQNFAQASQGGDLDQAAKLFAAILVIYAPLVLIPFAFKLAGGAIATVMNAASGATQRSRDGARKTRGEKLAQATAQNRERIAAGNRFKGNTRFTRRLNSAAQTADIMRSGNLSRSKIRAERSTRSMEATKKAAENEYFQSIMGDDDMLNAYALDGMAGARKYLSDQGISGADARQRLASIAKAEKEVGVGTLEKAAVIANASTGTGYAGGSGEMLAAIARVTNGDPQEMGRMVAAARSNAERANRPDLAPSFSSSAQMEAAMEQARVGNIEATSDGLDREVIKTKGASVAMQARGQASDRLIGSQDGTKTGALGRMLADSDKEYFDANSDLEATKASGATPSDVQVKRFEAAHRERMRTQAVLANMYDSSSYGPEENAERLGHVMAQDSGQTETTRDPTNGRVTTRKLSRLEVVERSRNDAVFRAHRRELSPMERTEEREALGRSGVPPKPPGA